MNFSLLRRFAKRKVSVAAFFLLLLIIAACFMGPLFVNQDPLAQDLQNLYAKPSNAHLLGTDNLGRDVLSRLLYGGQTSLIISFIGVLVGTSIGILLGVCAGYFSGAVDTVISRFIDILLAFPGLLLAIVIVAVLGIGLQNTVVAISIFSIPYVARIVRGEVLEIRTNEFIEASVAMGEGHARIIFTHIIPNAISQIIVSVTLQLGTAILVASSLSFLGLGVQPPDPEWGSMLSQARDIIRSYPLIAIFPGIAITLVVMSFSLIGDGLRDALDPRLKNF